jgi:hypothetical protein
MIDAQMQLETVLSQVLGMKTHTYGMVKMVKMANLDTEVPTVE